MLAMLKNHIDIFRQGLDLTLSPSLLSSFISFDQHKIPVRGAVISEKNEISYCQVFLYSNQDEHNEVVIAGHCLIQNPGY